MPSHHSSFAASRCGSDPAIIIRLPNNSSILDVFAKFEIVVEEKIFVGQRAFVKSGAHSYLLDWNDEMIVIAPSS